MSERASRWSSWFLFVAAAASGASGCGDAGEGSGGASNTNGAGAESASSVTSATNAAGPSGSGSGTTTSTASGGTDDNLASLPPDSGGTHTPHPLGTTDAEFGYYVYLPGGYADTPKSYPLLVFLHGKGERGDGVADLDKVLKLGVTALIEKGAWDPTYPMIVASPQYPAPDNMGNDNNWGEGHPEAVRGFIEHAMATYRVNPKRIYLTGLSHGGNGVYDYITQEDVATSHLAAAAPIAAWGPNSGFATARNTPIWVFVGSADTSNFNTSKNFVTKYNAQMPAPLYPAKFTVYAGAGHDVWTRTYDLTGIGTADPAYDPYDMSLFDWMFQYKRSD